MGQQFLVPWLLAVVFFVVGSHGYSYCVHHINPPSSNADSNLPMQRYILDDEIILADNKTVQCPQARNPCFSFWGVEIHTDGNMSNFLVQGCWNGDELCEMSGKCVSSWGHQVASKYLNESHYCCCVGDKCNAHMSTNISDVEIHRTGPGKPIDYEGPTYKQLTIIGALFSVSAVAVLICLVYLIYRKCFMTEPPKMPPPPDNSTMYLVKSPSTPNFELDDLKFCSIINRGRFGEVWKGTMGDLEVAIKVFTASQRQYYMNERAIYMLPMMEHEALLHFYGSEERLTVDGNMQYVIVMSLVSPGNLMCYLKNNVLDWSILCKMSHSITSGLAYLHSEIEGEVQKPSVAHRDLNSRNVLVNLDLSCSLCDFGFAMKIKRMNFLRDGPEENVEQASLTDVGTLRYMAPEVLEGAVNLRDCESSLKQIDVYALGLVIWELASRCSDLYQGMPVPEYSLPFQAELGLHPTFEEMQQLVTKSKARPRFPNVWKDSNQAIRSLKETIEDCWDQDGEARLTALCVEVRILEMMNLWGQRHKGVTPTMLTSALGNLEEKTDVQHNLTQTSQYTTQSPDGGTANGYPNGNVNFGIEVSQMSEPVNELSQNAARRSQRISYTDNSVSAASTVETTLSPGDFDEPLVTQVPSKANCNLIYARTSKVMQPHHGQNPTVERNTHKRSDEDVTVMGNTLVSKSQAASASNSASTTGGSSSTSQTHRRGIPNTTATLTDELLGAISDNLESSLVQNDLLNQSQRNHHPMVAHAPIPYLQNQVHQGSTSEPLIVRPKQPNLPGNGYCGTYNANLASGPSNLTNPHANTTPKQGWFGKLMKSKGDKEMNKDNRCQRPLLGVDGNDSKSSSSKLSFPFFSKFSSSSSSASSSLSASTSASPSSSSSSSRADPDPQVLTEVRLVNGAAVVRPTSLPITRPSSGQPNRNSWHTDEHSSIVNQVPNGSVHHDPSKPDNCKQQNARPARVEVGIAKLEHTPNHRVAMGTRPGKNRVKSRSSADLTPNGNTENHAAPLSSSSIQLADLESNGRAHKLNMLAVNGSQGSFTSSNSNTEALHDDVFAASTAFTEPSFL